jgi:hypothetical protein
VKAPAKTVTNSPEKGTRTAQILALVARPGGATLAQVTDATG